MKRIKRFIIVLFIFQALLITNLEANACKQLVAKYNSIHGGDSRRFPSEVAALGGAYAVAASEYALTDVINDTPKLNTFGEIAKYEENNTFANAELENYLLSKNDLSPIFRKTVLISSNKKVIINNEIPVSTFKSKISKSNLSLYEKTFFIENQDIKNNGLHLHYIKIPAELLKSKQKLIAETTLIYTNPDEKKQLDFNLFKTSRLRQIEGKVLKKHDEELTVKKENCNISMVQKELQINSSEKPLVVAVYAPAEKNQPKNAEKVQYSCGKYIVLVKFKTATN